VILGREGVVNQTLLWLGLAPAPLRLLQTEPGLVIAPDPDRDAAPAAAAASASCHAWTPSLRDASAALGGFEVRTLVSRDAAAQLPGLVAGCMLVFASSTTAFISQFVIGGNRLVYLPLLICNSRSSSTNWPLASVAALTLLVSVGLGVAAIAALGRRGRAYAV